MSVKRSANKHAHTHRRARTDGGCPASAAASHHPRLVTGPRLRLGVRVKHLATSRASDRPLQGEVTVDDRCEGTARVRGLLALVVTQPSRRRNHSLPCEGRSLERRMVTPSTLPISLAQGYRPCWTVSGWSCATAPSTPSTAPLTRMSIARVG